MHFAHRRLVHFGVVPCVRVLRRRGDLAVFHVRHVDIDDPVEKPQRLRRVEPAAVVHKRQMQAGLGCNLQSLKDHWDYMRGRYQVDVVAPV
jgi:hypothetical protein